jgi:outer membrane protein TolC
MQTHRTPPSWLTFFLAAVPMCLFGGCVSWDLLNGQADPRAVEAPGPPVQVLPPFTPQEAAPPAPAEEPAVYPIDLVTALRLANADNPTIAVASLKVEVAQQDLRAAQLLWLPDLLVGPAYTHVDSWVQNAKGIVVPATRGDLTLSGGAVLSFDLSEPLFRPLAARQEWQASLSTHLAAIHQIQLRVVNTYLELLRLHAQIAIHAEAVDRAEWMRHQAEGRLHTDSRETQLAERRPRTEINLRRQQILGLEGQAAQASADLAALLHLPASVTLRPADPRVVPVRLIPNQVPVEELVATAYRCRPELNAGRAHAAAVDQQARQAAWAPALPHIQVGYTGAFFGGGPNDTINHLDDRATGVALATWQFNNLGLGDLAHFRQMRAQALLAHEQVTVIQLDVGAEVVGSSRNAQALEQSLHSAEESIREALEWWNLERERVAHDGGNPLDLLVALQTLAQARTQYLQTVISYNEAQFRLYTALGNPSLEAIPQGVPLPTELPVLPTSPARSP